MTSLRSLRHRVGALLSGFLNRLRALFRSDPRRATAVSVSLGAAVLLIGGALVAMAGSEDGVQRIGINGETAGGLFSGGKSKTGSSPETATGGTPTTQAVPAENGTTTSTVLPGEVTTPDGQTITTLPGAPAGTAPVEVPVGPGPGWVTQSNQGLALAVRAQRSSVSTGERVQFIAAITDPQGALLGLQWDFGDGTTVNADPKSCSDNANLPSVNDGRTDFDNSASHIYRQPGDRTVRVTARTGSRCGTKAGDETVVATGNVKVTGSPSMNGPGLPTAEVTLTSGGTADSSALGIRVKAGDSDGYISKIVIQWDRNDASSQQEINYPLASCADTGSDWPTSTRDESPAEHTYDNGGTQTVTVTVTSTGCDGTQAQQAIASLDGVTVGGAITGSLLDPLLPLLSD